MRESSVPMCTEPVHRPSPEQSHPGDAARCAHRHSAGQYRCRCKTCSAAGAGTAGAVEKGAMRTPLLLRDVAQASAKNTPREASCSCCGGGDGEPLQCAGCGSTCHRCGHQEGVPQGGAGCSGIPTRTRKTRRGRLDARRRPEPSATTTWSRHSRRARQVRSGQCNCKRRQDRLYASRADMTGLQWIREE